VRIAAKPTRPSMRYAHKRQHCCVGCKINDLITRPGDLGSHVADRNKKGSPHGGLGQGCAQVHQALAGGTAKLEYVEVNTLKKTKNRP
jgi:hypothetical protein